MTRDEIMMLDIEQVEARAAAIAIELTDADAAGIELLNAEIDAIVERKAQIEAEIEQRKADLAAVIKGAGTVIGEPEERNIEKMEIRNTQEYIDAYAKFIKTGKDAECRALLTENASGGTIPVPELVENRIRTAWERNEIWNRITKTYVRGNLKVGFEVSASDAEVHVEGAAAPEEEELVLGVVQLIPQTIKKWISFSTEVMALGSEAFLSYVYDELTYKIIEAASLQAIGSVIQAPTASTATEVGVPAVTPTGTGGVIAPKDILDAIAELSGSAQNRVFVANGKTIAGIKSAVLSGGFNYDPFFGLTVIQLDRMQDNTAVVGDLSGVQANLPEGDTVRFVFDEYSLAEKDLIKLVGRMLVAAAVVQPGMFANIGATV